jgi:superkiller protein 3
MIAISAYHADSWFLKGYAIYQMGKYEESLQFFDQALALNPRLHEALTYKGLIYSGFGRHSEALVQYDRALALNPKYGNAWYVKGLTLAILERYDEAIGAYEQVLVIEPKHFDALSGISIAMKKREKSRQTKPVQKPADLISAPPLTSPNPGMIEETSTMPWSVCVPRAKPAPLNILPSAHPPAAARKKISRDLFEPVTDIDRDQQVSSGKLIRDAQKTESIPVQRYDVRPQGTPVTTTSAPNTTQVHRNSYDELIHQTLEVLNRTPGNSGSLNSLGDLYIKVGKYQLATEAYEQVLERAPENARAWAALGDARRKLGIYDEAQFAYDRALEINNEDITTWINRAKALAMLGRYEEAIDSCDCAIECDCDNTDAWLYKGFILKKIRRHSDALHAYDQVLAINPHHDHAIRQRKTLIDSQ